MKRKMRKAFVIPPELSRMSHAGQVPTSTKRAAAQVERAFKLPKPPTEADRLRDTSPRLTAKSVVEGLGLDKAQVEEYRAFLDQEASSAPNETRYRQGLLQKMVYDKLNPDLRRVMADRATSYYRFRNETAKKSILSLDDLQKANPRGGRYYRRVSTEKGHRYYYDEERYHKRADAHLSGADVLRKREQAMAKDTTPGESLDETSTAELAATLQQLKDRHKKSPDAGTEARIKAISAELSKRGMKPKGEVEKAELSPEKARQILHDKEVHGKPLTDKQRGFMGAVASGTARKSMDPIDELAEVGDELVKAGGGEGSRGGKVIGHTKSGKPIYQSHVDKVPGYAKDLADHAKVKDVVERFDDDDGSKDKIEGYTREGARQALQGLEQVIENKHALASKKTATGGGRQYGAPKVLSGAGLRNPEKLAHGTLLTVHDSPKQATKYVKHKDQWVSEHGDVLSHDQMEAKTFGRITLQQDVEKSGPHDDSEPLEKAFLGGYSNWMDQFADTPLHVRAMELTRDCLRLEREQDKFYRSKPQWDERQKMDVVARAKLEEQERQQFKAFDAKRREYEEQKRDLEEKLLSQKIEAAKLRKSQSVCEVVVGESMRHAEEAPERQKRLKEAHDIAIAGNGGPDEDADGDVRDDDGDEYRGGGYGKSNDLTKAVEDTMDLEGWLQKSGNLPEGEPGYSEGVEVSRPEDGGKVAGVGKPEGDGARGDAGPPIGAPSVPSEKLSEDDAEVEKQMTDHKKPIMKSIDHANRDVISDDPAEGQRRLARQTTQLRKSREDSVYIPPVRERPEALEKSEASVPFSVGRGPGGVLVNEDLDRYIEKSIQGPEADSFYPHGRPTIGALGDLQKSAECPACGLQKSLALSACPSCGHGTAVQNAGVIGGGILVKSERPGPVMRRPARQVEVLPNGVRVVDE